MRKNICSALLTACCVVTPLLSVAAPVACPSSSGSLTILCAVTAAPNVDALPAGPAAVARAAFDGLAPDTGREAFDAFTTFSPEPQGDPGDPQILQGLKFLQALGGLTGGTITTTYNGDRGRPNVQVIDEQTAANAGDGVGDSTLGRWDTTKASANKANQKYLETGASFTLMFHEDGAPANAKGVSAFGTYITDVGDFNGSLVALLLDVNGNPLVEIDIFTPNPLSLPGNASLTFFGFVDTSNLYYGIRFVQANPADAFGFDDMVIGTPARDEPPGVPTPGALALVGLGLLSLGVARRRRN